MNRSGATRWGDLTAVLLLTVVLLTAAGRLVATAWVEHLTLIYVVTLLGGMTGLALGQSRFSPRLALGFALAYGLFVIPWQLVTTAVHLPPDVLWRDRLATLGVRLLNGLDQLVIQRQSVQDPVLFLCVAGTLSWAVSARAGYTLIRRGRPWEAIAPASLAFVIIHASDPYQPVYTWLLIACLLCGILLVRRLTYLRDRARWERSRISLPVVGFDVTIIPILIVISLIAAAWALPTVADLMPATRQEWRDTVRPLRELLDDAFAALRRRGRVVQSAAYYGRSFALGYGRELTDELALTVNTPSGDEPGIRYYWQARVYDRYADGEWSARAITTTRRFDPFATDLDFPALAHRRTVTITFTPADPLMSLYAAAQPRWVSRAGEIELAENPDGTIDLVALNAIPAVDAGESYQARSSVSDVTIAQLRRAGTSYPAWIGERYLQLPPTITPRTHDLAREIAAGMETPYDIAASVTGYLRASIEYTEMITRPIPADQELLDWFLFDLRQGFCSYYASAEVILLRSVGVPARLGAGFAQGAPRARGALYEVRQRDTHAWPEVYFPGIGWVVFEPTRSQAPIYRPLGEVEPGAEPGIPLESVEERWRERLQELASLEAPLSEDAAEVEPAPDRTALYWVLAASFALALVLLVWRLGRRHLPPVPLLLEAGMRRLGWTPPRFLHRWARRATLTPLERAYAEIGRALARLGAPPAPSQTPAERVARLIDLLPAAAGPARQLLAELHAELYGPHPGDALVAGQAGRAIRALSWRALLRDRVGRLAGPRAPVSRPPTTSYYGRR